MQPLLKPDQVAELLQVTIRTLENWRVRGGGPPYRKLGHYIRYAHNDLETWLTSQARRHTSDPGHGLAACHPQNN